MLAVHRVVTVVIFEPETPGGLRLSIDCKTASSSATADDMVDELCYNRDLCQMMGSCMTSTLLEHYFRGSYFVKCTASRSQSRMEPVTRSRCDGTQATRQVQ